MNRIIIITAVLFMCSTPLYAGGTPQENEAEAAVKYVEEKAPRAVFARESEGFTKWHTIEELLEKDKAKREANKEG